VNVKKGKYRLSAEVGLRLSERGTWHAPEQTKNLHALEKTADKQLLDPFDRRTYNSQLPN